MELRINKALDSDRSKLRALLQTLFDYGRMRSARVLFVHLVAVSGGVIWFDAVWPGLLSEDMRFFALTLWSAVTLVALFAAIEEYILRRKLQHLHGAEERRHDPLG